MTDEIYETVLKVDMDAVRAFVVAYANDRAMVLDGSPTVEQWNRKADMGAAVRRAFDALPSSLVESTKP